MDTAGFVGLGAMGRPMVRRLLDAGIAVVGYNRTAARARPLMDAGMQLAKSPRTVAEATGVVFTMVTDTPALEAVTQGPDGLVAGLRRGTVVVEMSTASPEGVRTLAAEAARRGATVLDAPVSGSPVTIEAGQLSFMVAGDPSALDRVRPYLLAIGPTVTHVSAEPGLAKAMKIATNLNLSVQMLAFSEAVLLAERAGIAREHAVDVLLKGVAASPMLKYRGPFVLGMPAEALFNVPMVQKDLRLALDLGRALGVTLPSTALAHEYMTAAAGFGLGEQDFAVVFDVLARMSGAPPSLKLGAPPPA
jgi:3-hydroxyisobutyrate dehydrogenase-like beta-hydroxyacid dehydrogenase